jgi:hypothetical protein
MGVASDRLMQHNVAVFRGRCEKTRMKEALFFDGTLIQPGPESPARALCPVCGDPVELKSNRSTWYYRHEEGAGAQCELREKKLRSDKPPSASTSLGDDPYLSLAFESVTRAVQSARRGSVPALLSLAFSQFVHKAWGVLNVDPEVAIDAILEETASRRRRGIIFATDDEALVLESVHRVTGPIFDLRSWHNGHIAELEPLPWYVPLGPSPTSLEVRMIRRVMELAERIYVLCDQDCDTCTASIFDDCEGVRIPLPVGTLMSVPLVMDE